MPRTAFYFLFLLSGAAGLGYQMIWTRMFSIGLGHELPGVLSVIAAFLGGMAAGSWALDKAISQSKRPGRWYGTIEILIGLWALATIKLIPATNQLAWHLIGPDANPIRHGTIAFLLPFLLLLPATAGLGATLPAIDRIVSSLTPDGRSVGALYAVNTLGAVVGIFCATFWIGPRLGWTSTLCLFALTNLAAGVAVLVLEKPISQPDLPSSTSPDISRRRLHASLILTGALGIGFEVLGVRILSQVLSNTVHTFSAILAVYLLGTATGAGLYHKFGKQHPPENLLSSLLCTLSCSIALSTLLITQSRTIYELSWWNHLGEPTAELAVALSVFFLPTVIMGAIFSLLVQSCRHRNGGVGKAAALNTLGGAIAPALFGVLLLPHLGGKGSLILLSLGYLLLLPRFLPRRLAFATAPALLLFLPAATVQNLRLPQQGKLLSITEGVMASVAVIENSDGSRILRVNNRFQMGGTAAATTEARQTHIPLLLHPAPKRALFLGLGTGISFAAAAPHPALNADGVELIPEVVQAMPLFQSVNPHPAPGSQLKVFVADARRFISTREMQYDVIVADLFHPARDGAASLYSLEHFRTVRDRLEPGGLFCQWLPLHQLDIDVLKMIIRTFLEVFPHSTAFLLEPTIDAPALGLVGSLTPPSYRHDWVESRLTSPTLTEPLRKASLSNSLRLFGCLMANTDQLTALTATAPLNTDDHPRVLFMAPKTTPSRNTLAQLLDLPAPDPGTTLGLTPLADNIFPDRISRYLAARTSYLRGLLEQDNGNQNQAIDLFLESARQSEDFTLGYAQCLSLASVLIPSDPTQARALLQRLDQSQPSRTIARRLLERMATIPGDP